MMSGRSTAPLDCEGGWKQRSAEPVRRPRREGQDLNAADSFRKAHVRRVHSCPPELRNNGDGIDTTSDAFRASGFTGQSTD
jgi:hypothetical protein